MLFASRIIIALVLGWALTSTWAAAPTSDFSLQRFGMTLEQVKQAAANGDPDAEYALGYMYYYGQEVSRDEESARLWIGKAAAQGQPQAAQAMQMLTQADPASGPGAGPTRYMQSQNPKINPLATTSNVVAGPRSQEAGNTVPPAAIPGDSSNVNPSAMTETATAKNSTATVPAYKAAQTAVQNGSGIAVSMPNNTVNTTDVAVDLSGSKAINSVNATGTAVTGASITKKPQHKTMKSSRDHLTTLSSQSLRDAPKNYYTIQLLGSHHKEEVAQFIREHHMRDKAIYYETTFQNKPWYVLVYGIYATDRKAEAAIKQLPLKVQRLNPWVKSINSVKESMKAADGSQ